MEYPFFSECKIKHAYHFCEQRLYLKTIRNVVLFLCSRAISAHDVNFTVKDFFFTPKNIISKQKSLKTYFFSFTDFLQMQKSQASHIYSFAYFPPHVQITDGALDALTSVHTGSLYLQLEAGWGSEPVPVLATD